MSEISVTLKASGAFGAPWITVKAETPVEINSQLIMLRDLGVLMTVKGVAAEFAGTPTAAEAIENSLGPTTEVAEPAKTYEPSGVPVQGTPPCETCGKPTTFKDGNHPTSGKWAGYFCETGDRTHTKFIKV